MFAALAIGWLAVDFDDRQPNSGAQTAISGALRSTTAIVNPLTGSTHSSQYHAPKTVSRRGVDEWGSLESAADAGHPESACRLAWSMDICLSTDTLEFNQLLLLDSVAKDDANMSISKSETIAMADTLDHWVTSMSTLCASMPTDAKQRLPMTLYRAAQLGDTYSMARFALNPPLDARGEVEQGLLDAYRANAIGFLKKAAESGDTEALRGLHFAYYRGRLRSDYGTLLVEKDKAYAHATGMVLLEISRNEYRPDIRNALQSLELTMNPRDHLASRQIAARYRSIFSGMRDVAFNRYKSPKDRHPPCLPKDRTRPSPDPYAHGLSGRRVDADSPSITPES